MRWEPALSLWSDDGAIPPPSIAHTEHSNADNASTVTITVTTHSSTAEDDVLVAYVLAHTTLGDVGTLTTPAGFTELVHIEHPGGRGAHTWIGWKRADSGDADAGDSYSFSCGGGGIKWVGGAIMVLPSAYLVAGDPFGTPVTTSDDTFDSSSLSITTPSSTGWVLCGANGTNPANAGTTLSVGLDDPAVELVRESWGPRTGNIRAGHPGGGANVSATYDPGGFKVVWAIPVDQ